MLSLMTEDRKYGLEVESKSRFKDEKLSSPIETTAPTPLTITPEDQALDDILLEKGELIVGGETIPYRLLSTVWNDFEISCSPFKRQEILPEVFVKASQIIIDFPDHYKPWTIKDLQRYQQGDWVNIRPTGKEEIIFDVSKTDLSVQIALDEMGFSAEELPPSRQQVEFEYENSLKYLPVRNTTVLKFFESASAFSSERQHPTLRIINGKFVLHLSFNFRDSRRSHGLPEIGDSLLEYTIRLEEALKGGRGGRTYQFSTTGGPI